MEGNTCHTMCASVIPFILCRLNFGTKKVLFQVILAKEAGLCYASMGLVTDYDSWREDKESVGYITTYT